MALISRVGASAGLLAALSLVATPAFSAELPQGLVRDANTGSAVFSDFDTTTFDSETDIAEWRGRGWGRGWRGGWRRGGWRGHRRVDAGDVVAGVLILGGIAAIANAANRDRRRDRVVVVERDRDDRRYDRRDDRREDRRFDGTRGLERAANQCVDAIERDVRVDSVDSVDRTASGWVVSGVLFNGSGFTCAIDNDGRIDAIDYGEFRGSALDRADPRADGQYDDDTYLAARQKMDEALSDRRTRTYEATGRADEPLVEVDSDLRPAYPGGPLPGEEFPE